MSRNVMLVVFLLVSSCVFSQTKHANNSTPLQQKMDSLVSGVTSVSTDFVYDENLLVAIPSTHIKIQAPEFFYFSETIPGFIHPGTATSIQVQEVVGTSYIMISSAMDETYFASQGMTLISSEPIVMHDGSEGILYTTELQIKGVSYERLILITGNYHYTIWVNANYAKALSGTIKNVVLQSLLTSKLYE